MPTYRFVLKKSLALTIKNKKLLYLGFFLALIGNGGEYDILIKNFFFVERGQSIGLSGISNFFTTSIITERFFNAVKDLLNFRLPISSFFLILVFMALIYITTTAQGAIIGSVYNAVKKNHTINIKKAWIQTRGKFFELLAANLVFKGGGLILAFIISTPIFMLLSSLTSLSISRAALITGALVFTPLAVIVSLLAKYTLIFIVTKNKTPLDAFYHSIALFKVNWLITLENTLLLFVLNFALGLVTWILAVIVSFPIITALVLTAYPLIYPAGHFATIIAWTSLALITILGSALSVFQYTSWTVLFTRITAKRKLESKLVRMMARLIPS